MNDATSNGAAPTFSGTWRESSGIARYLQTVRARLVFIVACVVVATGAAVLYVKLAPRTYTATAQIVVNPASSDDTVLFSLPVLHATGVPTQDVLTASSVLHTPAIAQATIADLHLRTTANHLLGRVSVVPFGQSDIISVSAKASTATKAQVLANAYVDEAIAVRTANLHQAIVAILPGLRSTVARLPASERQGVGTLGDQVNQLEQLRQSPDPTVSVNSDAILPTSPSSPKSKLSVLAGILVGLLLGIGAAFALDAIDSRIRREDQLRERFAGIPVLARIPHRSGSGKPGPLVPTDLSAQAVEQYHQLRAILAPGRGGPGRAYLLTGSSPSEGKTTSAINFASVLAQSGTRVILIEGDLRRPTIGRALGLRTFRSTEEVLSGRISVADAVQTVRFGQASLGLLAAQGGSPAAANRLSPVSAGRVVEQARQLADVVVVDSPPLTAVVDALAWAQVVDSVLVAVRVGHSRITKLAEAREQLHHQGSAIGGFILIDVRQNLPAAYGYGRSSSSLEETDAIEEQPSPPTLPLGARQPADR